MMKDMGGTVRFRMDLAGLSATAFACSALQEAVLSLRMWTRPWHYPEQAGWFRRMRGGFSALDTHLLQSLVAGNGWMPDFLTPRPSGPWPDFAAELDALRQTPPWEVRASLERAFVPHDGAVPRELRDGLADPPQLLERIADALRAYWEVCLAPNWWPRARTVLEADIAHRARRLAGGGADALFADLDRRVRWRPGVLTVEYPARTVPSADVAVGARGLVLAPTLFARGAFTAIAPERSPVLGYPARGRATMAEETAAPPAGETLRDLLGARRAQLLTVLGEPAGTTELARRFGITPAAVSQHLGVLYAARLVNRTRSGRVVLYARSPLGDQLCGGA
jgi:DNA-binding transcriptional ArsR family regulator